MDINISVQDVNGFASDSPAGLKGYFDPVKPISFSAGPRIHSDFSKSFYDVLSTEVNRVNERQLDSSDRMQKVDMGDDDDLVGAVMAIQKASMTFQLLLQVRNKMLDGYSELMSQQL